MKDQNNDALFAKIKESLTKQADAIKGADIFVSVVDGNVVLKGVVDSQKEREKAIEIARGVDGVQSVKDEFRVMDEQPDTGVKGPSPAFENASDDQGCSPSGRVG